MYVSLQDEGGGAGLEEEGLLVDPGRDVLLVLPASSKVEGQGALLLAHPVDRLHHVVASVAWRRLLGERIMIIIIIIIMIIMIIMIIILINLRVSNLLDYIFRTLWILSIGIILQ